MYAEEHCLFIASYLAVPNIYRFFSSCKQKKAGTAGYEASLFTRQFISKHSHTVHHTATVEVLSELLIISRQITISH